MKRGSREGMATIRRKRQPGPHIRRNRFKPSFSSIFFEYSQHLPGPLWSTSGRFLGGQAKVTSAASGRWPARRISGTNGPFPGIRQVFHADASQLSPTVTTVPSGMSVQGIMVATQQPCLCIRRFAPQFPMSSTHPHLTISIPVCPPNWKRGTNTQTDTGRQNRRARQCG